MNDDFDLSELLTTEQIHEIAPRVKGEGGRRDRVYKWIKSGRLKAVRLAGCWYSSERWLKQMLVDGSNIPYQRPATVEKVKAKQASKRREAVGKVLDSLGV